MRIFFQKREKTKTLNEVKKEKEKTRENVGQKNWRNADRNEE